MMIAVQQSKQQCGGVSQDLQGNVERGNRSGGGAAREGTGLTPQVYISISSVCPMIERTCDGFFPG